jgi:hypothetical protein
MKDMVSSDFFVVPTVFFRVLFVFVILSHDRRRPVHVAVTEYPTAEWVAHQLLEAFPWDSAPHYLFPIVEIPQVGGLHHRYERIAA